MNKNHIVRVRNKLMQYCLKTVAMHTKATYQECFVELCDMFQEGHVLGVNTHDELFIRIIRKTSGEE